MCIRMANLHIFANLVCFSLHNLLLFHWMRMQANLSYPGNAYLLSEHSGDTAFHTLPQTQPLFNYHGTLGWMCTWAATCVLRHKINNFDLVLAPPTDTHTYATPNWWCATIQTQLNLPRQNRAVHESIYDSASSHILVWLRPHVTVCRKHALKINPMCIYITTCVCYINTFSNINAHRLIRKSIFRMETSCRSETILCGDAESKYGLCSTLFCRGSAEKGNKFPVNNI